MGKNKDSSGGFDTSARTDSGDARTELRVAYHAGPEEIGFCGRTWQRGVAQSVTADEWAAMQARGDIEEFNFTKE